MTPEPDLTEKNRRQEEQARRDRERHLQQQRAREGMARDTTGESPIGGRVNERERERDRRG